MHTSVLPSYIVGQTIFTQLKCMNFSLNSARGRSRAFRDLELPFRVKNWSPQRGEVDCAAYSTNHGGARSITSSQRTPQGECNHRNRIVTFYHPFSNDIITPQATKMCRLLHMFIPFKSNRAVTNIYFRLLKTCQYVWKVKRILKGRTVYFVL